MQADTSSQLLRLARNPADQQAWQRVVESYAPLVRRWLLDSKIEQADADDLMQEILLTLWRELPNFRYRRQQGKFRSWLRRITENRLLSFFRSRNRRRQHELGAAVLRQSFGLGTRSSDGQLEFVDWLRSVCRGLPHKTRQAFWLTEVEGQMPAEVARHLGMTTNAVYLARRRVLGHVRASCDGLSSEASSNENPSKQRTN